MTMMTAAPKKPRTFNADLTRLPAALLPLTKLRRWVIWKWEERESGGKTKWTKPPYQPKFPKTPARSNDASTWGTYEDAVLAFSKAECDGIGLMLKGAELAAIDLDHIRDFATGQVLRLGGRALCRSR
jgi:primase-polymerase (primpol)-like protein